MPLEAVKIPQNVYVEDRIIGPITLRHLLILGVGAGISYVIWAMASASGPLPLPLTIVCWTPLGIAAAFCFVKINDISLFKIILLMIERSNKPNQRKWGQHAGISINFITKPPKQLHDPDAPKVVREVSRLTELSRELEKSEQAVGELMEERKEEDESTERNEMHKRPVEPEKIHAEGLDPSRTLDGIRTRDSSSLLP